MSFTSRLVNALLRLPPAETHDIIITRDIQVPMPDGVVLLADHYAPRAGPKRPTILVRTPYGRTGFFSFMFAYPYVTHGYQVFVQSCRGTAGSGGEFRYARNERADGLATIAWIKQQDWFSGELAMAGGSYLGFVQWAVAADVGPEMKALVPSITSADFNHFRFQGGSFELESSLGWSTMMTMDAATGMRLSRLFAQIGRERRLKRAYGHLPLGTADQVAIHQSSEPFQSHLQHGPDDDYWQPVDVSDRVGEVTTPIYLQAGWYDLFLDWQLKDYQRLRAAGHQPYLLVGPWTHGQFASIPEMTRETLAWLNAHIKGDRSALRETPVRLFVMGANEWRALPDWPPPAQNERWHLQPGGALTQEMPPTSEPDRYRYDPANPTPAVGGNSLGAQQHMGPKDNRALEARADVLVYTSAALERDMEVIGPVTADLYVASSLEHTDFFARLCVVEPSGKSINLCDGIVRLTPHSQPAPGADGIRHLQLDLWPTAYRFRKGQRIRVQVSSGAHPRFVRNLGTGESLATATKMVAADQAVYHDPEHPSAFILPVLRG
jgi:putative CocE/NonD family hydrolase